jgi:hypothetical protein
MSAAAALPDPGIQLWELHSELSVVSAEVRKRALELLPERDPSGFLSVLRRPNAFDSAGRTEAETALTLPLAVAVYALARIAQMVRSAACFVAGAVALASFVELLR